MGGRLCRGGARREIRWSHEQEQAFLAHSTGGIRLAFLLALHTGQRQGDLLSMPWRAYDGESIRLKQGKTSARVRVPVTAELKAALDAVPQTPGVILTNRDGEAWTADGFRSSWRKACARAGVEGVTFRDLHGTAATRLQSRDARKRRLRPSRANRPQKSAQSSIRTISAGIIRWHYQASPSLKRPKKTRSITRPKGGSNNKTEKD
ncbi:tyrosine-type recombinase/integrase [Aureimonas sp. AU40]|uniref:tyrosine-type recombinase/integrase n=1 Tax=Aureimonas sp. AU40 TaxID=1637747 RepID=UPI0009EC9EA7